ncbi:DEAD-box ATP-dependent RNA helicase 10-like protein [Tanacetum coccineum]
MDSMLGNLGIRAIPISGQMVQMRIKGLDIPYVDTVINLTIPPIPEDYIHRVERNSFSFLLVTYTELVPYMKIERQHIGKTLLSYYAHNKEAMSLECAKEANQLELKVSTSFELCISY